MHAVVFEVDMKPESNGDPDAELDALVGFVSATPGFVRGTWTTNGTRGLSFLLFETEEAARAMADNAFVPPDASVTLRSATAYEVVRDVSSAERG